MKTWYRTCFHTSYDEKKNLSPGRDKKLMKVHSVEILGCQLLALLIHSHLEAFSTESVINLIDVILFLPAKPKLVQALPNDWATNPLQPISIRSLLTYHYFILHCSTNYRYLMSFLTWDSAIFSSHDTVNSHMITCFIVYETRIMCGQSCVQTKVQGISTAHPDQQITPNLGLCYVAMFLLTVLIKHSLLP